jgi:putative ABC transport system permease protein
VLAAASLYEIVTRPPAPVSESGAAPPVDRLVLLFPILFVAGLASLAIRGLRPLLPRLRAAGAEGRPALFLASRRLASGAKAAGWVMVGAALGVGMLAYAGTLSSSIRATASQHALIRLGSETAATFTGTPPDATRAPKPSTLVVRVSRAEFVAASQQLDLDVLGIDPATFPGAAYWEDEFADRSLMDTAQALAQERAGRVPILLIGTVAPVDPVLRIASFDVPVAVVGRPSSFPGRVGDRPMVVASTAILDRLLSAEGRSLQALSGQAELWTTRPPGEAVAFLNSGPSAVLGVTTVEELRSTPGYLALTRMLGFLQALGVLTALIAMGAAYLYLQSRQRQSDAAYALARRMGLSRSSHRASVGMELAGLLLLALVVGAVLALGAALLTYRQVALGEEGLVPLFRLPLPTLGATAIAVVAVSVVGAALVQRAADRTDVAGVMRLAE